jgi:hypothetical protein
VALAAARTTRLRADAKFRAFVSTAPTVEGRDEAARGLAEVGSSAGREALVRASLGGRVRSHVAARLLVDWKVEAQAVAGWIEGGKRSEAELGCVTVAIGAWRPTAGRRSCEWTDEERNPLLAPARSAILHGQADAKRYVRTALERPSRHHLLR